MFLLHGANVVGSRERLLAYYVRAKEKSWDVIALSGEKIDFGGLLDAVRGQSLISSGQLVVIENLLSTNRASGEILKKFLKEAEKDYLKGMSTVLVLWEKKTIDGRKLRSLQKYFQVEVFKTPVSLFAFLDSLGGSSMEVLVSLQRAKRENPPEMLLAMMGRQVRLLIQVKAGGAARLAPWQKRNLENQAARFELSGLIELHSKLLDLDRKQKKSQLPEDLSSSLDLLVVGF